MLRFARRIILNLECDKTDTLGGEEKVMERKTIMETKNVLLSMDDDYFSGCMDELEDSFDNGWTLVDREYDECTNTSFLTLERELAVC